MKTREQKKRERERWRANRKARGVVPAAENFCRDCGFLMDAALFWKDPLTPNGLGKRCKNCIAWRSAKRYATPEGRARRKRKERLKKYGLKLPQFQAMVDRQGGVCAVCSDPPEEGKPLHIDHCHRTGKVRALLCPPCNVAIGLLKDSPSRAMAVARYLKQHGQLTLVEAA